MLFSQLVSGLNCNIYLTDQCFVKQICVFLLFFFFLTVDRNRVASITICANYFTNTSTYYFWLKVISIIVSFSMIQNIQKKRHLHSLNCFTCIRLIILCLCIHDSTCNKDKVIKKNFCHPWATMLRIKIKIV